MPFSAFNTTADTTRRKLRLGIKQLARRVNHEDVVEHVREEGQLSGRYIFMTVMSCAIAMLGLLLSSPAVIIGAMLISPLMGPIMLMGFSLSILELKSLRQAVFSMFCGVLAALAISIAIVKLSPLTEATSEILARTRPNFFDLLVAVFSGLAGGYAVIHRKGETIVGVAIATALMPPLAVTGYGIAVGSWPVASGAFFLFMTNLLAIALSVTVLSRIYGFGAEHSPKHTIWQSGLIFLVFGALSLPLGIALRDIAFEASSSATIRAQLLGPFPENQARIGDFAVAFPREGAIRVDATILTTSRVPDAEQRMQSDLSEKVGRMVELNLDQVIVDADENQRNAELLQMAESSLAAPLRAEISRVENLALAQRSEREIRNAVSFPLAGADIDADTNKATFFAAPNSSFSIAAYRAIEAGIATNFPEWQVWVVPPVQELPLIVFEEGGETLNDAALRTLDDSLWALEHWGVSQVEVVGYASTAGALQRFNNQALAFRRADAVAQRLLQEGIDAQPVGEYRAFRQEEEERVLGYQRFQTVLIRPF